MIPPRADVEALPRFDLASDGEPRMEPHGDGEYVVLDDVLALYVPLRADVSGESEILAELELMTSEDDTEEAAQCDGRWFSWLMRQARVCHGNNASLVIASAITEARRICASRHAAPLEIPPSKPASATRARASTAIGESVPVPTSQ